MDALRMELIVVCGAVAIESQRLFPNLINWSSVSEQMMHSFASSWTVDIIVRLLLSLFLEPVAPSHSPFGRLYYC